MRRLPILAFLLILAAQGLAFSPLPGRAPQAEDARLLDRLERIDSAAAARMEFARAPIGAPLPVAALCLRTIQLAGAEDPEAFVVANLCLHALNVLLLLGFLRRRGYGVWAAALVAGAFALHPVQVENVARLAGLGEHLGMFFVLVGLHLHAGKRSGLVCELGLLACLAAGVCASPVALMLPAVLVLLAPDWRRELAARVPLVVASLLLATLVWQRSLHELLIWPGIHGPAEDVHHFLSAMLLSLMDLTGPWSLAPMHAVPPPISPWVPAILVPILILFVWAGARRTGTARGAMLLLVALAFVAWRGALRFEYRADGWVAPALVAFAWIAVVRFGGPGRFRRTVAVMVLASWAIMAHGQAATWVTERSMLDHAIAVDPQNWMARIARAELSMESGDARAIEDDAVAALVHQPGSVAAAYLLGYARGLEGDDYALQRMGWHGSRTGWNDRDAAFRVGYLFLEIGRTREAITLLRGCDRDDAHAGLALAAARLGEREEARRHIALAGDPRADEARIALAWLLATAPEPEIHDPARALELLAAAPAPDFLVQYLDARAAALAGLGRAADAWRDAQEAARRAEIDGYPSRAEEIRTRALVYLGSQDWREARASAPAAHGEVHEEGEQEDGGSRDPRDP